MEECFRGEKDMKTILFIIGSTRKNSFNRQLAKIAEEQLQGSAEVKYLDYSDLPFFNQDTEFPTPDSFGRIRKEVESADGLWIFTPEYNSGYPGCLKNLIDWLSRSYELNDYASGTSIKGKPVTISGAAGKNAATGSRTKLYELLQFTGMKVFHEVGEGFAVDKGFMTDKITLSDDDIERLKIQATGVVRFISEES